MKIMRRNRDDFTDPGNLYSRKKKKDWTVIHNFRLIQMKEQLINFNEVGSFKCLRSWDSATNLHCAVRK